MRTVNRAIVRGLVYFDLLDWQAFRYEDIEYMFRDVFGGRAKWKKFHGEPFCGKGIKRLLTQRAFLDQERMVEPGDCFSYNAFEFTKIAYHILFGACTLKFIRANSHLDLPAMAVQVLAFAMVVGKKMGRIEIVLREKLVQCGPFVRSARI